MCQRANRRANVPKVCQLFNLASKCRANVSFWCANVPKGMSNFQTFFSRNAKGNFYTLLLYKKFYIILDIIVTHMIIYIYIYIYISYIKFVLYFISISSHIKEKCTEFLIFETFLFFSSK